MITDNIAYLEYLQHLLEKHHIDYLTPQQFYNNNIQIQQTSGHQQLTKQAPLKTNLTSTFSSSLIQRYSRQMLLKEIEYQGQIKIANAKIAIIGAGGVGCPLALYLAAAGVGTLGIFDSDIVQVTNLHRQIGHRTDRIGMKKTQSLKLTMEAINPHINIKQHPFVTVTNSDNLGQYDLVIDGSDNPMCRYIVNDYCMKKGKKLLSGACVGWEAQIACFGGNNLCYRCLWGNDQVSMGGCSTLGVVGMVPGLVGIILGTQAIKLILQGTSSLQGKLLTYDGRKCDFKKVALRKKQEQCIGCGPNKLDMETYDYLKYGGCSKVVIPDVDEISWKQFLNSKYSSKQILDVRPSNLYNIVHFISSQNIPYDSLSKMTKQQIINKLNLSNEDEVIPVSCVRGVTSKHAVKYLNSLHLKGFSLMGGILGYRNQFDSSIPQI